MTFYIINCQFEKLKNLVSFFALFFFLTLHQFNGGDGYNAYYYKGET
jgi:hypothetical protein